MKEKYKKLLKNTTFLFISSFSSKVLIFLLVPLYTSVLSTQEYGIYDLLYSVIQLVTPIFTLNIMESIFRFSIEESNNKKQTFTIGIKYIVNSIVLIVVIACILNYMYDIEFLGDYLIYSILLYSIYVIHDMIIQFTRGLDKVKDISIAGVIETISMILLNILFLIVLRRGLRGYFMAMILSLSVPTIFLIIKNRLWQFVEFTKEIIKISDYEKQMIMYSLPLIFISLSWYINNVADRITVSVISGVEANGIYSISYKIPAILNALQSIFVQAWQISAIKEYKSESKDEFYTKTYNACQIIMVMFCSILIMLTKIIAKVLFAKEFYSAWEYVPILLIYIVFNTLSGTVGAIFSAAKDTKKLAMSGIVGAIINILLNIILVYKYNAMGAAIATLISSIVIWAMRMIATREYIKLKIDYKSDIVQYIMLIIQSICMMKIKSIILCYTVQLFFIVILVIINIKKVRRNKNENI